MKKYLLLLASVLFLWNLGFASQPDKNGTIGVEVVKHLEFTIVEPSLKFTYNEADRNADPPTDEYNSSKITVTANVNWKLDVSTQNGATELINTTRLNAKIPASRFSYYTLATNGITSVPVVKNPLGPVCVYPITGDICNNFEFYLHWRVLPVFTENLYAGDYVVDINYILSEQ